MIDKPYEVIIIGSGATGGMAALTMAKAGVRVLVIERGPELEIKQANGTEPCNMIRRLLGVTTGNYQNNLNIQGSGNQIPYFTQTKKQILIHIRQKPRSCGRKAIKLVEGALLGEG